MPIITSWNCPELWGHCDFASHLFYLLFWIPALKLSRVMRALRPRLVLSSPNISCPVETVPSYEGIATLVEDRILSLEFQGWNCPELWGHCDLLALSLPFLKLLLKLSRVMRALRQATAFPSAFVLPLLKLSRVMRALRHVCSFPADITIVWLKLSRVMRALRPIMTSCPNQSAPGWNCPELWGHCDWQITHKWLTFP